MKGRAGESSSGWREDQVKGGPGERMFTYQVKLGKLCVFGRKDGHDLRPKVGDGRWVFVERLFGCELHAQAIGKLLRLMSQKTAM
jgi:hypothetical protein